jgi:hypothetical protein
MFECPHCQKTFTTYRGLNGHQRVHTDTLGSYSVGRKRVVYPTFVCLNCGIEKEYDPKSSNGKYCSNRCQGEYRRIVESKKKISDGTAGKKILRRHLVETKGEVCEICGQGPIHNNLPLILQMDHIDGNSDNNQISNVRLLCPNCHTQTKTFCSRNKKNTNRNRYLQRYKSEKTNNHSKKVVDGEGFEPPASSV